MTHTSHPYGYRLGITKGWKSKWFAGNSEQYRRFVKEDFIIRDFLNKELKGKMVSDIKIERDGDTVLILLTTARPGLIIGRDGLGIEELTNRLKKVVRKNGFDENVNLTIRVEEIRYFEKDASIVAELVVESLEKRMPHRRLLKQTVDKVMANRDVKGARIVVAGRLGGAEIARKEEIKRGNIPLQTIRADIDFSSKPAVLSYGTIGVKVWIYKGEIFDNDN